MNEQTVEIGGRTYKIRAWRADEGWAPEAVDDAGEDVYLGGEDDEDSATPAEALEQGERLLRDQAERGNLSAECSYCGVLVRVGGAVPAEDDVAAWARLATEHGPSCEWVETRAHRLDMRGGEAD